MSMRLRQHHIANNWPTASLITPGLQASAQYWVPHAVPFHWPKLLGGPPLMAAQFGDQPDHSRVGAVDLPISFLALVAAHSIPPVPPGRSAMSPVDRGPDPGSSGGNLLRLARPSAAPPGTARIRLQPITPSNRGRRRPRHWRLADP